MSNPLLVWFSVFVATGFFSSYLPSFLMSRLPISSGKAKLLENKKWTGAGFVGSVVGAVWYIALPYAWVNNGWVMGAFALGAVFFAHVAERRFQVKDDSRIVIDEWLGIWVTLWGMPQVLNGHFIAGFILFRIFDVWKGPWMIPLQRFPGGVGIVADDLLAGFLARFFLFFIRS